MRTQPNPDPISHSQIQPNQTQSDPTIFIVRVPMRSLVYHPIQPFSYAFAMFTDRSEDIHVIILLRRLRMSVKALGHEWNRRWTAYDEAAMQRSDTGGARYILVYTATMHALRT